MAAYHNGWHTDFQTQLPQVRFPVLQYFLGKIIDIDEGNQQHCLEESEQWLENVDQIQFNLVLASGKLVLKKAMMNSILILHILIKHFLNIDQLPR